MSAGKRFKQALKVESPLKIVGAINAYAALQAKACGLKAIYLSGGGVAAASCGMPDLGMTTCADVLTDVNRILAVTDLPLLVDIDAGWGNALNIRRSVQALERAGVAAIHIEDQVQAKRCGHRPNKAIVSVDDMCDRIKACVDARVDHDFIIMARTDAIQREGREQAIERAQQYLAAGADMIFPEACTSLEDFQAFSQAISAPILANITEFGQTPLFTADELKRAGIQMMLFPMTAFRAMSEAARTTYETIAKQGSQQDLLPQLQTRDALYETLHYHEYEAKLDAINQQEKDND